MFHKVVWQHMQRVVGLLIYIFICFLGWRKHASKQTRKIENKHRKKYLSNKQLNYQTYLTNNPNHMLTSVNKLFLLRANKSVTVIWQRYITMSIVSPFLWKTVYGVLSYRAGVAWAYIHVCELTPYSPLGVNWPLNPYSPCAWVTNL